MNVFWSSIRTREWVLEALSALFGTIDLSIQQVEALREVR